VVEQHGGRRFPRLRWRSPRSIAVLAGVALPVGVALLAGLVAGYAAGHRQAVYLTPSPITPPGFIASPVPYPAPSLVAGVPALIQSSGTCATQIGRDLQLGVQVTNQSPAGISLGRVEAVLPLGGLKAISQRWAPCGALPSGPDVAGNSLAPGASTWFTVTFKVLMTCPGPLPVQFTVHYAVQGLAAAVSLPGFPDLSHVPYSGCPAG
jgi:hypothetical protein